MFVTVGHKERKVDNPDELESVLQTRDKTGGAEFWLSHGNPPNSPALNIRVTGDYGCVTYFPSEDRHPGFRAVGDEGIERGLMTNFVFDGCDPSSGEEEPNEFVMSFSRAVTIAKEFLSCADLPSSAKWFEL